jgi:hypothetical protein
MDVMIEEVTSRVNVVDSQALLNPEVIKKIVQMVMERLKEHEKAEASKAEERKMRPSMTAREAPVWEG